MNLRKIMLGVLGFAGVVPGLGAVVEIPVGTTLDVSENPGEACQYVVEGTMNATKARDIINYDGASITVKSGGVLNINCDTSDSDWWSYPGFIINKQAVITVESEGLLNVQKNDAWGHGAAGLLHLNGGTFQSSCSQPDNRGYFRNVKLSNGARITGGSIGAGWCQDNWSNRNAFRGTMVVDGTAPSFIDTTYFTIGGGRDGTYESVTGSGDLQVFNTMGLDLTVNDVTGDARSDLVVNARVTVWSDFQDWPADKLYLTKTGAGTVEFAGGIQALPALQLEEGTVLVQGTGNTLGQLRVAGDATLSVADGSDLTLGSLVADGGTLTLDANLNACQINVGAIDETQLDAIVYQGKREALVIEDGHLVSLLGSETPVIGEVTAAVENITTAIFTAQITDSGVGAETVDLYVALGETAETLGDFVQCGTAEAGATSVTGQISGLEEGVTYYYQAKLKNANGESKKIRSGNFRTAPMMSTVENAVCYSGLLQGKINVANDFETDIRANSVTPLEVMPGAMMADIKVAGGQQDSVFYTNPYTGNMHKWNVSNTTFGYYGEIYLTEGATLNVGKNVDDSGFVKIGEKVLIQNGGWQDYPVATFAALTAGWYPIELRVGDGSDGKGVTNESKFDGYGLAYNFGGATDPDATGWKPFVDEQHNGSFLRCHYLGRHLQMSNVQVNGDDVIVWLGTAGKVPAGTTLKAYYGAKDWGEQIPGWENERVLATASTDELLVATKYALEGLARYGALRFALVAPGSETLQGWTQFSPVIEFSQVAPSVSFDFDGEAAEETVKLTIGLTALGLNATKATVFAEVSTSGDFTEATRTQLAEVQTMGTFSATLQDLEPATEYAIRLVVENDRGEIYTTDAKTFTTYNANIAHPGDTLVWTGGESGYWNTTSPVWSLPNGTKVAWLDTCTAKFITPASVTVEGEISAARIEIQDDAETVTFGGGTVAVEGALTFGAASSVTVANTLRFGDGAQIIGLNNESSTASELVIAGNLDFGATLQVTGKVIVKTTGTGVLNNGNVTGDLTLADDAVLELASTAAQTMKGKITVTTPGHGYVMTMPGSDVSFTSNTSTSWELRVAGDTYIANRDTYPQPYNGKGQTHVLAGGTLRMGHYEYWYWGPNVNVNEGLFVEEGGTLRLVDNRSLGWQMGVTVNGGTMINESKTIDCLLNKCQLNDGATLTGNGMQVGFSGDYYYDWSYIRAGGSVPSTVSLDEIQIGCGGSCVKENNRYVGLNFIVDEVTGEGDDVTDLLVKSPITERARTDKNLFEGDYRTHVGIVKQGEGTLELAANNSCCTTGVFKCEAGTVRFPKNSGGSFGALLVVGDATMDVKRGAKVSFEDSSAMAWTEGKKLSFTGDFGRKDVRVGTSADALTADQLAAIQYVTAAGKTKPMTLDDEGYLQPPAPGMFITVR